MRCLLLQVPVKQMSAFTASKCAVAGLAEAIRAEVEPLGLHIGQVYPGLVKSNFMERAEFYGQSSDEERKAFRQQVGWALKGSNAGGRVTDFVKGVRQRGCACLCVPMLTNGSILHSRRAAMP